MSDVRRPGFLCEADGSFSMRRLLALFFSALCAPAFYFGILKAASGWWVFIPGLACIAAALLLLFFTTWSDITEIVKAATGKGS